MKLPPYLNEPYSDFTQADQLPLMQAALKKVRAEFGKEYPLLIAGEERTSSEKDSFVQSFGRFGSCRHSPKGHFERCRRCS